MNNAYEIRGDVTAIFLNSRKYGRMETLISTSDLERAKEIQGNWGVGWDNCTRGFYVLGKTKKPCGSWITVRMHRWVLSVTDSKMQVDHVNHDTLNNTRSNLNIVTRAENGQNARLRVDSSSGYTGIVWDKTNEKWRARITVDGSLKHIGYFDDIDDALFARKEAEKTFFTYKQKIAN